MDGGRGGAAGRPGATLPTRARLLLTTHYVLLTTHYLLLTTYYLLLTTYYLLTRACTPSYFSC